MTITWQIKAAIILAIAVAVGLVAWFGVHEYHQVMKDQQTIGSNTQVIATQQNTIQTTASSAAVTDVVVASSVQGDQNAVVAQTNIDAWVASQTKIIGDKYATDTSGVVVAPPVTPTTTASGSTPVAKPVVKPAPAVVVKTITSDQAGDVVPTGEDAEIQTVQLTGSWMKYCAAIGNGDPKCTALPQLQS